MGNFEGKFVGIRVGTFVVGAVGACPSAYVGIDEGEAVVGDAVSTHGISIRTQRPFKRLLRLSQAQLGQQVSGQMPSRIWVSQLFSRQGQTLHNSFGGHVVFTDGLTVGLLGVGLIVGDRLGTVVIRIDEATTD